jgi:hypothetical protein
MPSARVRTATVAARRNHASRCEHHARNHHSRRLDARASAYHRALASDGVVVAEGTPASLAACQASTHGHQLILLESEMRRNSRSTSCATATPERDQLPPGHAWRRAGLPLSSRFSSAQGEHRRRQLRSGEPRRSARRC